ncbi:hypothetical protein HW555_002145 [Spodoptera exigua]|uniref:Uncharacterized protein n=1 Tax=Spodoptera exigua TaxID=7107 RepID=A0A835GP07_SPOEX|nr:hypothetical protein HW555_002145 [Spodoptera exigua]
MDILSAMAKKFVSYNKYLFFNMNKVLLCLILAFTFTIVYFLRSLLVKEAPLLLLFVLFILFLVNVIRTPQSYKMWNVKPIGERERYEDKLRRANTRPSCLD